MSEDFDARAVWRELHNRLGLSGEHFADLGKKRGFSPETIDRLGFRSSVAGNRVIVEDVVRMFPGKEKELARLDIIRRTEEGWRTSPQLCGFGKSNRKDKDRKDVWEMGANPILIPYYDEAGDITFLRPHKGNPKRSDDVDDFDEEYISQHIYCPMLLRTAAANLPPTIAPLTDICIVTEGEFKAGALWQCGIPALGLPGIHAMRNFSTKRQLIDLLVRYGFRRIIIAFDNESKDNPEFSNYKEDPDDRYDTIVYAEYTSQELRREGFAAEVLWLPEEWKEGPKADWDGALARFVVDEGDTRKGTTKAAKEFAKLIRRNREENLGILSLFPGERERVVQNKLNRIYYRRKAPHGDDKLMKVARTLFHLREGDQPVTQARQLSGALRACNGCYYLRKQLYKKQEERTPIENQLILAREQKNWALVQFLEQLLMGWPEAISNFLMHFDYKLVSASGKVDYLVRIGTTNREKTSHHIRVPSSSLSRLANFRDFLIGQPAAANFEGGEKDLQRIVMDGQADCAHKEIREVESYGYMEDIGLWKFADRAYDNDGHLVLPDKNRVFWYNGTGYQTDFFPTLGHGYGMGAPVLGELDDQKAAEAFCLLSRHMFDIVGDFDGWLALGAVLAYPVHPEILREYKGAPGLWMTGPRGSGKSSILEWLMRIFGFPGQFMVINQVTTGNGVSRELSKYHSLPCCYDEFDNNTTRGDAKEILKNAFMRQGALKATFDGTNRTKLVVPQTTPIIGGENSSQDSATRQRYLQIIVSQQRWRGSDTGRLREMTAAMPMLPNLGHFLIKNRRKFVEMTMSFLKNYTDHGKVRDSILEARARWVSGTSYAAWEAACIMLEEVASDKSAFASLKERTKNDEFQDFSIHHGSESQKESQQNTRIATFWQYFLSSYRINKDLASFMVLRYVQIESGRVKDCSNSKKNGYTPAMYISADTAFAIYESEMRKIGRLPGLGKDDVVREAKREKYWLRPKPDQTHKVYIKGNRHSGCWCIDLNELPNGDTFHFALMSEEEQKEAEREGKTTEELNDMLRSED